jgi:hypothetical protein
MEAATAPLESSIVDRLHEHQMSLPSMDGYTAQKLAIGFSGSVDLQTNEATDVRFIEGLRIGQEVELVVTATVTKKTYGYSSKDDGAGEMGYGVGLRVHSFEVE